MFIYTRSATENNMHDTGVLISP